MLDPAAASSPARTHTRSFQEDGPGASCPFNPRPPFGGPSMPQHASIAASLQLCLAHCGLQKQVQDKHNVVVHHRRPQLRLATAAACRLSLAARGPRPAFVSTQ